MQLNVNVILLFHPHSAMGVLAVGYCVALVSVKYFVTSDTAHIHIKTG